MMYFVKIMRILRTFPRYFPFLPKKTGTSKKIYFQFNSAVAIEMLENFDASMQVIFYCSNRGVVRVLAFNAELALMKY